MTIVSINDIEAAYADHLANALATLELPQQCAECGCERDTDDNGLCQHCAWDWPELEFSDDYRD